MPEQRVHISRIEPHPENVRHEVGVERYKHELAEATA